MVTHVSIVDIARIAQVSPLTVSRALQDHPRISPERRGRDPATGGNARLPPEPNGARPGDGPLPPFGAVVTDVTDPFVAEVLKGAAAATREAGYGLLFAMSNREPAQELAAAETLLDHEVDGLIVISARVPARYLELPRGADRGTREDTPLVLVNNELAGPQVFSVRMDNAAGTLAGRHVPAATRPQAHCVCRRP